MSAELAVAYVLVVASLLHSVEDYPDELRPGRARRQVMIEYFQKVWGGIPGMVPRADPGQQAFEAALVFTAQALAGTELLPA